MSLESLLGDHCSKVLLEEEDHHRITVRRRHVFQDAITAFRTGFQFKKHLAVTFLGEPAVDAGGPCREFLRLLMQEMCSSTFFDGLKMHVYQATIIMLALEKRTYLYIGQLTNFLIKGKIPHYYII